MCKVLLAIIEQSNQLFVPMCMNNKNNGRHNKVVLSKYVKRML